MGERLATRTQRGIEHGGLQSGFCHAVPHGEAQQLRDRLGCDIRRSQQGGREVVADDGLDSRHVFARVDRVSHRDALAPTLSHVRLDMHEQDVTRRLRPEARLERAHERHRDAVEGDGVDFHNRIPRVGDDGVDEGSSSKPRRS